MVAIPIVNWIIIGIEILVGILWASVFIIEIFPLFRSRRINYKLTSNPAFSLRKSITSDVMQIIKTLFNLLIISVIIILSYHLTETNFPYYDLTSFSEILQIFTFENMLIFGIIILFIPRFFLQIFFPVYFVRQLKYMGLLGFVFLPLFVLDQQLVQTTILSNIPSNFDVWLFLMFPTQLLAENGITLTLEEKQYWFVIIFVLIPSIISFLYQILPFVFGRIQKFGIYEWKLGEWHTLDDTTYDSDDDTAVLLLHGLNSTKEMWSAFTNEIGSERVMDYIDRNTDERYLRTKIFGLEFSDRLKQPFSTNYKLKKQNKLFANSQSVQMNNYAWELFYTIYLLKEVKEIERIHIICHSSSGIILRYLLNLIYEKLEFEEIAKYIGYNKELNTITTIDKISWLAVPHFGAQGGAAIFLSLRKTFPFNIFLRGLFLVREVGNFLNRLGGVLLGIGLNAPATQNLDPYSRFIKKLNGNNGKVKLYGKHDYKNAFALKDQVTGQGALIKDEKDTSIFRGKFDEQPFNADHSNAPWEQLSQLPSNKISEYPPIHHSIEVIDWILGKKDQFE